LKVSKIKFYRTKIDILMDASMKVNITKAQEENRKIELDFYNYFNKNDRFILKFIDINIFADTGLVITKIMNINDRSISFMIAGGLPEKSYDIDVVIMLNDGQVWKGRLVIFIGMETGV